MPGPPRPGRWPWADAGAPGDGGADAAALLTAAAAGALGGDGAAGAAATLTDLLAGFAAARPAPDRPTEKKRPRNKACPARRQAPPPPDSPIGLAATPSDSPAAARPASGLAVFADASGRGQRTRSLTPADAVLAASVRFDIVTWNPVAREEATIGISACKE